jgi:transcriptional regulator with XRE-family HTH domain
METGRVIRALRKQQGLTQEQLSEGIMDTSNFSRIETGKFVPSKIHLNIIMERLGYSADTFISNFVNTDEARWFKHKDQVITAIVDCDISKLREHISVLENNPIAKTAIGKQFLKFAELCIQLEEECHTVSRQQKIIKALKITIPKFAEERISEYFLSRTEIFLVNQLALHYLNNDDKLRGIVRLKDLAKGIRDHYIDEQEKAALLSVVLYNLSKYLGLCGFHQEAVEVCDEGIKLCVDSNKLNYLPGLIFNKAYCLNIIDSSIDCKSLVYQAYYGCVMSRRFDEAKLYKEYAKEKMGISVDV